jgi:hypothetical protein
MGHRKGNRAGNVGSGGYRYVFFDQFFWLEHRLIWAWSRGWLPRLIDHINGDPADNRISNLRPANDALNSCNRGPTKRNTTGFKGVTRTKDGKYTANITRHKKTMYLGSFERAQDAGAAYMEASKAMDGEFAWTGGNRG